YVEGCSELWTITCDIAIPCATHNEIDGTCAETLVKNGEKAIMVGADMHSTTEAVSTCMDSELLSARGRAVNAGGVSVSSLEMRQNSAHMSWTFAEVDSQLKNIMANIYNNCMHAAEECNQPGNLIAGANIAGFTTVANAMIDQGIV